MWKLHLKSFLMGFLFFFALLAWRYHHFIHNEKQYIKELSSAEILVCQVQPHPNLIKSILMQMIPPSSNGPQ